METLRSDQGGQHVAGLLRRASLRLLLLAMTERLRILIIGFCIFILTAAVHAQGRSLAVSAEGAKNGAVINVSVPPGLHVMANPPSARHFFPTSVELKPSPGVIIEAIEYPPGEDWTPSFSPNPIRVLKGDFTIRLKLRGPPGTRHLEGILRYQPCDDKACFLPAEAHFDFEAEFSGGASYLRPEAETTPAVDSTPASVIAASPLSAPPPLPVRVLGLEVTTETRRSPLSYLLLFLLGVALNLTPCVYPLIPVTVGYFGSTAGERSTLSRLALIFAYGVALALSFAVLGIIAAATGGILGSLMTNTWVLVAIALLLVAMALWSFGLFEIPLALSGKLAGTRRGLWGAAFMGATAGLVAAPCIGPVIAGLFLLIAQTRDLAWGFTAFGAVGLGIATPLGILGFAADRLQSLPRPGAWMVWVKKVFGFLLLLGALYPLLPVIGVSMARYASALVLLLGFWILLLNDMTEGGRLFRIIRVFVGVAALAGAISLFWMNRGEGVKFDSFEPEAFASEKTPRVVDVYATWCLPCVQMDQTTLTDAGVLAEAGNIRFLRIDITFQPEPATAAWLKERKVVGVPSVLFFDAEGREIEDLRLTGFEGAEAFRDRLREFRSRTGRVP